jgi:16S rRNA (cytosine1402-N4)-methyltransferase
VLAPRPGEIAVDCTVGYGGHARELLKAIQPGGRLIAIDADPLELPKTESRLRALGFPDKSLIVRRMNFAGISSVVLTESPEGADVILADLGLSSMQIDNPDRGFTFKTAGPLDMRLNPQHGQPASVLLSKTSETELARILAQNADEPNSQELARVILASHSQTPLETTTGLATVVMQFSRTKHGPSADAAKEMVRRAFQAIRIAVNDEFGALDALLRQLPACLKPKGRVAILSFHSGEDRRVKHAFKDGLRNGVYSTIAEEVIRPSIEEQKSNPRSTSAKLRFAVRAEVISESDDASTPELRTSR